MGSFNGWSELPPHASSCDVQMQGSIHDANPQMTQDYMASLQEAAPKQPLLRGL